MSAFLCLGLGSQHITCSHPLFYWWLWTGGGPCVAQPGPDGNSLVCSFAISVECLAAMKVSWAMWVPPMGLSACRRSSKCLP